MTKLFPNQKPDETVLCIIRKHWFAYIPHLLLGFLVMAGLVSLLFGFYWYFTDFSSLTVAASAVFTSMILLAALFLMLYGLVDHYLDILVITDEKLIDIKQNGLFGQEINEIHLLDIENISVKLNGVLGVYLKFGSLEIRTGTEHEDFTIDMIPKAAKTARYVMELHTKYLKEQEQKISIEDVIDSPNNKLPDLSEKKLAKSRKRISI